MNPPKPCCDKHGLFCKSISESGKYCEETGEQFSYRMEDVHEWTRQLAEELEKGRTIAYEYVPHAEMEDITSNNLRAGIMKLEKIIEDVSRELLLVAGDEKT